MDCLASWRGDLVKGRHLEQDLGGAVGSDRVEQQIGGKRERIDRLEDPARQLDDGVEEELSLDLVERVDDAEEGRNTASTRGRNSGDSASVSTIDPGGAFCTAKSRSDSDTRTDAPTAALSELPTKPMRCASKPAKAGSLLPTANSTAGWSPRCCS
ncbi:MAG: hypothetical protein ABI629_02450 [bacterium]